MITTKTIDWRGEPLADPIRVIGSKSGVHIVAGNADKVSHKLFLTTPQAKDLYTRLQGWLLDFEVGVL